MLIDTCPPLIVWSPLETGVHVTGGVRLGAVSMLKLRFLAASGQEITILSSNRTMETVASVSTVVLIESELLARFKSTWLPATVAAFRMEPTAVGRLVIKTVRPSPLSRVPILQTRILLFRL